MTTIDKAIVHIIKEHSTCDEACRELWLVKELQKARNAVKAVLQSSGVMTTTDIKAIAQDLRIEL